MAANSVIAGILVARLLGPESFGILIVLNVTVSTAVQLSSMGLPTANTYFTAGDRELLAPAAVNGLLFALIGSSAFTLAIWASSSYFLPGVPLTIAAIGLFSIPFQLATLIVSNLFLAQGEIKRSNYIDLLNQSFVLINPIIALLLFGGGLVLLLSMNLVAAAGVSIATSGLLYRYIASNDLNARWRGDLGLLKKMLLYAVKGHVFWAATMVMLRIDVVILNSFRGPVEAAVYGVATQYTLFLMLLPNVVANLMLQRVASSREKAGEFSSMAARHVALSLFIACLFSIPAAYLLPIAYGPGFVGAPALVWILLPGVFFWGVQLTMVQYFVGTGLPIVIPALWVATLLINIVLNIAFIPRFGAEAAAAASTVCYFLIFVAVFIYFRKDTGSNLRDNLVFNADDLRNLRGILRIDKVS